MLIRIKISSIIIILLLCVSVAFLCMPVKADTNANNSLFVTGLQGDSELINRYYVYVNDTHPSFTVKVDVKWWKGSTASNMRITVEKPGGT
ncbi:MAG: hypothetical protein ACFFA5_02050, partial [Promethearchaeota archaeon]